MAGAEVSPRTYPVARAAYIHVPFCARRCGYCNFTLVAQRDDLIESYLRALERELSALQSPRLVETLYLGGGTPTHLPPDQLDRLLGMVLNWHPLIAGGELTVEANPRDLDESRREVLAKWPVGRCSLGAQSFSSHKLRVLERDHTPADIHQAAAQIRGIETDLALDLIFAAPGESIQEWRSDLAAAIDLAPDHVSTYGLTFEKGTSFWARREKGVVAETGDELQREMFATAIDELTSAGFEHYEVSNFAIPGHRSRHNQVYWSGEPFYAAGPGAARYLDSYREVNHRSTTTWIRRVLAGESPVAERDFLPPPDRARELLVLGLRRMDGVDRGEFYSRTGFEIDDLAGPAVARFVQEGLLDDDGRRVRLTREGLFVSDALWPELL
jgi:oxygen-independent coproporphyrinogen III oxidase